MKYTIVRYVGLLAYTLCVGVLLWVIAPHNAVSLALLSLLPMVYFWRRMHMHSRVIFLVALGTVTTTALYEIYAHVYGIWYAVSPLPRLATYIPVESFVTGFLQVLYMITLYEFFCDDRKTAAALPERGVYLAWTVGFLAMVIGLLYILPHFFISYAFLCLILTITALVSLRVGLRGGDVLFASMTRIGLFLLLWLPISAVYEYVAIANGVRVYANIHEYVYTFTILNTLIPIEALLFAVLSPLWVISLYELHVDDSQ